MKRALFLLALATAFTAACSRPAPTDRCERCGMKLDPAHASWSAELVTSDGTTHHYDAPRCALEARRDLAASVKELRVHEYYDTKMRSANDVVFVIGSDVDGPMGPDLVPVDPTKAKKFIADHAAKRAIPLAEITPPVLAELH
jgi:nitrous oxide reductase accessory protein NosL